MTRCLECGAPERDGLDCRGQWDHLLALEFSDARAGSVHFLTVACYQLQHPASFSLGDDVLTGLHRALRSVVVDGVPVEEVRQRVSREFDGATRVRTTGATAPSPSGSWSTTVADVGPPEPEQHATRITDWARAVLADLAR